MLIIKKIKSKLYIFFLVVALALAVAAYMVYRKHKIPKIIWTYWDKEPIPDSIKFCMKTWKKHNPNYQINLLTRSTFRNYVNIPERLLNHPNMNDCVQRFSDLVRIHVMAEHGGVWCDSSVIMSEPLDSWLDDAAELNAFTIHFGSNKKVPAIENWFYAAPPESAFVRAWRDEFCKLADYRSVKEYVAAQKALGTDLDGWTMSEYLAQHVANLKLIMVDKYPLGAMNLQEAADGPFKYLVKNNWDARKGLLEACHDPSIRRPFLKLRGGDRKVFETYFDSDLSNNRCGWI